MHGLANLPTAALHLLRRRSSGAKRLLFFILDFGIFSTGLNALDVCWLCGVKKKKKRKKMKRQVLSLGNLRQNFHVGLPK